MAKIIEGVKTILFPFKAGDFPYFFEVYHQTDKLKLGELGKLGDDENIKEFLMFAFADGKIIAWTAYTKQGKASKKAGIIYLFDITNHSCSIHGIVDKTLLKGLAGKLKQKDKLTYAEDSLRAVIKFCFADMKRERVDTTIPASNRLALALAVKCGFRKEGKLRSYAECEGKMIDVVILSILKGEFDNIKSSRIAAKKEKKNEHIQKTKS